MPQPNEVSTNATLAPNPLLVALQTTALKDLSKFTGEYSQKVIQFIRALENLHTFTQLDSSTLYSIAVMKLDGPALNWYQSNRAALTDWPSLRTHLLEHYQPSSSDLKTQLKVRRQQPGEPLLTFYDDVIDLCQQIDPDMPLHLIIDFLQDGVRDDLKIHIKRRLKMLSGPITPSVFFQIARDEEELLKETFNTMASSSFTQPYFPQVNAVTRPPTGTTHSPPIASQFATSVTSSSYVPRSSRGNFNPASQTFRPCLICRKSNHRTIDCYQKQATGCFKCGDPKHTIRHCPQVFQ